MGEQTNEDGRLKESRDKVNRSRNIAGMGDVHVSTSEWVFLCVWVSDIYLQVRLKGDA